MLYYDRITVFEGIDIYKISKSKECDICHEGYFLNYSLNVQPNVCNRCQDLLMMPINFSDIAILNIRSSDYHCTISLINENEATKLMKKGWFDWKKGNITKHEKSIFVFKNE